MMTSAGEGSRSARRWTEVAGIRETARRVEQDGNATVARCEDAAADPRGTLDGAFTRPIFEGSGFWGLSRAIEGIFRARRRTFLGRVLVWCLVALGLTCLAARTTRVAGAPITRAILLTSSVDARCVLRSDAKRIRRHTKTCARERRRRGVHQPRGFFFVTAPLW